MLIDVLAILHLIIYPMLTGVLFVTTLLSLVHGNRWILVSGPAFTGMIILTVNTHINYLGYMS